MRARAYLFTAAGTSKLELGDLHSYDPVHRRWTNLSAPAAGAPPSHRDSHGFAAAGGLLYVHGGESSSGARPRVRALRGLPRWLRCGRLEAIAAPLGKASDGGDRRIRRFAPSLRPDAALSSLASHYNLGSATVGLQSPLRNRRPANRCPL